ncbi:alpha/beta fold hydrolase [Bradyrhizobium sp. dw_78]|uniref:alpha/beta hydrolase family protein n=1 Tax=Bradyrhizobium sp. dw_78 TaxID=2719793 RepID=UPI001BD57EB6|nr:alpha/beta fold hydrolase [Bradyrhizobium sp. dw_78]
MALAARSYKDANMSAPSPVASVRSIVLPAPERGDDLQVRISAPVVGVDLPVIVFSHGFGSSMDGYLPLTDYWAAHGFVVIQPTHLDSRRMGLSEDDPRRPSIWRFRVDDVKRALDNLDVLERSLPGLAGRVDHSRVAAAGHSFGGQTTGMLLGAQMVGSEGQEEQDMSDPRISVGVLLAAGGLGGKDLSAFAAEHLPYLNSCFSELKTPTLVVAGDNDHSPLTVRGPDWFYDPYYLSPGAKALLTLFGGEHMLGGISGYTVTETTDENPERVALVQRMTWAFLRSTFYSGDPAWRDACDALMEQPNLLGQVVCK